MDDVVDVRPGVTHLRLRDAEDPLAPSVQWHRPREFCREHRREACGCLHGKHRKDDAGESGA